ncbi:MAG TPA: PLP-dependent aminotransferase family protein [Thermoleophilaceae bacterium]
MPDSWSIFREAGVDLHLPVDRVRGKRRGIERALRDAIREGRLNAGDRLPSTRSLAAELGTARGTVAEAYGQLVAEGWLSARQGAGTVVADVAGDPPAASAPARGREPRFDFRPGTPDVSGFPRPLWVRAMRRAMTDAPDETLRYDDPRGQARLREALAAYLARARGVRADPDRIVVTSGFRQGLGLVCRALAAEGVRRVALEDHTVPTHRDVVAAAGVEPTAIPVDDRGAGVEGLDGAGAVVVTPAHQFPLGVTLAPGRRAGLVAWARANGGFVVEDDYDGEFRYDRQPVGALQALDPDRVVYAGTASKTLAPGLRLAWLVLPQELVEPVAEQKEVADGGSSAPDQLALATLIATNRLDRHLRGVRTRYRRRRDALVAALAERAPALRLAGISAGLHAVVRLPRGGPGERETLALAEERSLSFQTLGAFHHRGSRAGRGLVIGYGTPPEHGYGRALGELAAFLGQVHG